MPPAQQAAGLARACARYSFHFSIDAPAPRVFELVTPEGERQWAPGWNPRYLTPSKLTERTVFETGGAHHPRIWIIDALDAGKGHIRYVALKPNEEVATIDVSATSESGKTRVAVSYSIVSLDAAHDASVRDSVPDPAALGEHWREAFESALQDKRP